MRKVILKYSLIIIILLFLLFLFSPFFALFFPRHFGKHVYAEMVYQVIADEETKDCQTEYDKILALFSYVRDHIHPKGYPYPGKPLDYLITGRGWCDYQARTFNSLSGKLGILSRYAMQVDKDGISPNTLNEVFINGKWVIFDIMFNIVFKYNNQFLDTADLKKNPELITSLINQAPPTEREDLLCLKELLLKTLPFEEHWRRSTPRIKQYHIMDYLIGFYTKIFGNTFVNFYQDCYLKVSLAKVLKRDELLFLMARHYHILYRKKLAINRYEELIKDFPHSEYVADSIRLLDSLKI